LKCSPSTILLTALDQIGDLPGRCRAGLGTSEHERDERLVHHDRIRLIDDGYVCIHPDGIFPARNELIAQHIEAQLIDRPEDDIALVDIPALISGQILVNSTVRQPEEVEHGPHPPVVTTG